MVPVVDIAPLFEGPTSARDRTDRSIIAAASESGFFTIAGPSDDVPTGRAMREAMLALFDLSHDRQRALWRNFYEPSHANIYRGWSPRQADVGVDIFDMGPDVARVAGAASAAADDDPLLGATPLPADEELPGWRESVATYSLAMGRIGAAIMRSVARGLGIDQHHFDDAFHHGISTLRLMRYELPPVDPAVEDVVEQGLPRRGEHVDSGFVTLLCQHGVAGLEAKLRSGEWIDIPPVDGHLAVNFGGLLERWTEGQIRATAHRVISHGSTRCSIPFFYEPRTNAVIEPLPIVDATPFEPFTYGDHLWAAMSKFPNFAGIADLRAPRGVPSARRS